MGAEAPAEVAGAGFAGGFCHDGWGGIDFGLE